MKRTLEDFIGNTPLVRLQRLPGPEIARHKTVILAKLEGNNPAGSVKDRPAIAMIRHAERSGRIKPGATLIEPTSGNTGIALAMAAATRGYRMVLIMPEHLSAERRQTMRAYGAEIVLTPQKGGLEAARHLLGVGLAHVLDAVDALAVVDLGQVRLGPLADARDLRAFVGLAADDLN